MAKPSGVPPGGRDQRIVIWAIVLFGLFLAALASRLPYSLTVSTLHADEEFFGIPTVRQFLQGEWPVFLYGNAYMAPVQEWFSSLLVRGFGESLLTWRLPGIVFGCLAICAQWAVLTRTFSFGAAIAICLPLLFQTSAMGVYMTYGVPSYAIAMLCGVGIQGAALWLDRRRSFFAWFLFGVLAGFSAYVFKILAIQIGTALLWLFFRSDFFAGLRSLWSNNSQWRRRSWIALGVMTFGAACLILASYRPLTRPGYRLAESWELPVAGIGALTLFVSAATIAWRGPGFTRGLARVSICAIGIAVSYLPPVAYFQIVQQPRFAAQGMEFHEASKFALRHAHEWPAQAAFFLERLLPVCILGRYDELFVHEVRWMRPTWRTGLSIVALLAFIAPAIYRWRIGDRPDVTASYWLVALPVFVVVLIMIPSWRLNGDWSFRYLFPFQAGAYVALAKFYEPVINKYPRTALAAPVLYAAYGVFDTYFHTMS